MVDRPSIRLILDEAGLRQNLQSLLQSEGYQVTTAEHGAEGLQTLQQESFDLVIADVVLPEMDGFQVTVIRRAASWAVATFNCINRSRARGS